MPGMKITLYSHSDNTEYKINIQHHIYANNILKGDRKKLEKICTLFK